MTTDDDSNRRQDRRRKVRVASILVSDDREPIPCVILDISASGARLHIHDPVEIPKTFHLLQIANDERHECEAVWRNGNEMGVKFLT